MKMQMILSQSCRLTADLCEINDDLMDREDLMKQVYAEIVVLRQKIRDEIKPKLTSKGNQQVSRG